MEAKIPEALSQGEAQRKIVRSFFTKKLERKFQEKKLDVPQHLLNLLDVPFASFTSRDREIYEAELKPLSFVFAEQLMEVYETMGRPRDGWQEMLDRVQDSPAKVIAALVIHEEEKIRSMEDPMDLPEETVPLSPRKEKIVVRTFRGGEDGHRENRERWWERKIF